MSTESAHARAHSHASCSAPRADAQADPGPQVDTLKTARVRGPRQYVLVAEALRTTSEAALVLVDRIPPALLGSGVAPCLSLGAVRSSSVERRVKVTSEDSEGGAMPENEVNMGDRVARAGERRVALRQARRAAEASLHVATGRRLQGQRACR